MTEIFKQENIEDQDFLNLTMFRILAKEPSLRPAVPPLVLEEPLMHRRRPRKPFACTQRPTPCTRSTSARTTTELYKGPRPTRMHGGRA